MRALVAADVIAAPVLNHAEAFKDPQILHNQMLAEVEDLPEKYYPLLLRMIRAYRESNPFTRFEICFCV